MSIAMTPDQLQSFRWITNILFKHNIIFQITGGLAAKIYGSQRPLNDIDIDVQTESLSQLASLVKEYVIYGPSHYNDGKWDLQLMTLRFNNQEIDISGDKCKIYDDASEIWMDFPAVFLKAELHMIEGISVPVVNKEQLLNYKKLLGGEHQRTDCRALSISSYQPEKS